MTRYMILFDDGDMTFPREDLPAVGAAVRAVEAEGRRAGVWVFAAGVGAPSTATVIDNRGGASVVTDGPFVESKEYLAGFWVIDAPDLDMALKLAAAGSRACNRKVEVRPLLSE